MNPDADRLPPRLATCFLRWYCRSELLDEVEGDLYELFQRRIETEGLQRARLRYWLNVLMFLHPDYIRKRKRLNLINHTAMLRNYFIIALRSILKQKSYSLLNIIGLSLGLACTFLITLWIQDEMRYDSFHESGDHLYRVMRHVHSDGQINTSNQVTWNIGHALQEYSEVRSVAVTNPVKLVMNSGELSIREEGIYASPGFFAMFTWHLVQGDPEEVLRSPSSFAISTSLAEKYFGKDWPTQAMGGTIRDNVDGLGDFTVTGIFEDIPRHSSLQFDFVLPMQVYESRNEWLFNWMNSGVRIFARLHEGADGATLSSRITNVQNEHIEGFRSDLFLQPYTEQHLYSGFQNGVLTGGRIEYVRMFTIVALVIILIACINFMNLATARSMRRAKEIGVRKAIGAKRGSLIVQFMGESCLLVSGAFVLAMVLISIVLPFFNQLTEKSLTIASLSGDMLLLFVGVGVVVALIAGLYPALYLSSFDAVRILRGSFRLGSGGTLLRKGLVVFQFAISILLIGGTLIVYQQMQYIHSKNLGLDRENVISIPLEGAVREKFPTVKEQLRRQPGIASVTATSESPLDVGSNTHSVEWRGKDPNSQISMNILMADFDFLEVMRMKLVVGRDFDPRFGTDSFNYIVNRKAADVMGLEEPIGEQLSFWGRTGTIVGVVDDFHMTSLYDEIAPTIIQLRPKATGAMLVRTQPGRTSEALASLQEITAQFNPAHPFEYHFLDEHFRQTYHSEMVVGKLAGYFTAFALFIACLGLFGLAAYAAERRTKEIGIRKVVGATVVNVVSLLNKDFLKLVIIGSFVAIPVTWYLMHEWLQNFAYQIEISGFTFLVASLFALLIALITVSFQSIKAARVNPAKSLRAE